MSIHAHLTDLVDAELVGVGHIGHARHVREGADTGVRPEPVRTLHALQGE